MAVTPDDFFTERRYWNLIERTLGKSSVRYPRIDRQEQLIEAELHRLSRDEFTGFLGHHFKLDRMAYRNDLWAVAFVVMGGCSDDLFMDFRNWLVTRRQSVFLNAIENPDSLSAEFAKIPRGDIPAWEYYYHVLFDHRFGDGAFEDVFAMFDDKCSELIDDQNAWSHEDSESLRRVCPVVFERWAGNLRF